MDDASPFVLIFPIANVSEDGMDAIKNLKENLVLVICAEGYHRDPLLKALRMEGFQVNFVSNLTSVNELLADMRPFTLLHDWGAVEPSQSASFQQRLGKVTEYASLCRIIYAETVTPQLVALASDCGVRRVVSYATSVVALVQEIKMAHAGLRNLSDVQKMIAEIQSGGKYDQKAIDEQIEKAYAQFAHDPAVKLEYGNRCLRHNDLLQSRQIAKELLDVQPQNVRAMNLLARVMMKEGQMDEAIKLLEGANVLSPFNTDRLVMLGDTFFKAGDNAKASTYYNQAMSSDPENKDAQKGLSQVKLSEGDINGALELIRNSASEEEAASFFNSAAVHASHKGKFGEALRLYEAAFKTLHTNRYKAAVFFNMSLTLEQIGRLEDALKAINRALKYDAEFSKALRQKARLEKFIEAKINSKGGQSA